ncbi:MAG TPA: ATP-binding protein [Gaiellaceae bacterium]
MRRLPLRIRLALVFAAATALVLSGAGWFVYERVASDLSRALDQQLRGRAQDLSALIRRGGSLRTTGGPLVEPGESFAELVSADGRVLDATAPIGRRPLLTGAELIRARRGPVFVNRLSAPGLDEPARMLAVPIDRNVLVAGATRENRAEILGSLRTAFLIGGPLALVLTSLGGYVLAGAALRPIEAMRRRATEISSSSLDERLPVPGTQDEVSRLGETLNEMLSRLEEGLARERRFVSDASHQLRTPLALLKTELELALRRARSREELEQTMRSAVESAERLTRLADDLLLLARAEEGRIPLKAEQTDVADVLLQVAGRFGVEVDADPLVISADRLRLEQALTNMVDNALRHGSGNVTMTARVHNGTAELHVLDEGSGFPEDFLDRAFERFSRFDAAAVDGSGLGLAIVETIARAHDGRAHAANRPEGGADVWLALPLRSVR